MRTFDSSRLRGLEPQPRHECAQVGITPADLAHGRREQAVLGFDRSQPAADCGCHFDDLHLVTGPKQPNATDQSGQSTPNDNDRCHLDDPRSDLAWPRTGAGTPLQPGHQPEQWVFVIDDEGGSGLIHGRLGSRE